MNRDLNTLILTVLQRTPQWIRHELAAKDDGVRDRAEETLAAILAEALAKDQST